MSQLKFLTRELQNCQGEHELFDMHLHFIDDANTTCNDGTPAGYFLKKSPGSKRWIVYLEGGWYCHSRASCDKRYASPMRDLMSSTNWPSKKRGSGILSPDPEENPNWWNANHVYVPYCSSDIWSGNASKHETGKSFSFLGTRIIDKVIELLLPQGLYRARHLLLAGSSAGGIGVMLNLDRVATKLAQLGSKVHVRGLTDSGWYRSDNPLQKVTCKTNPSECSPSKVIEQGSSYWEGVVPQTCADKYGESYKWKCYFGENIYPTLSSPLFVFQWLYDMTAVVGSATGQHTGINDQVINLILALGKMYKHSFRSTHVHAVFTPACLSHTILTRSDWLKVHIKGYTLSDTLECWYQSSGHNGPGSRNHPGKLLLHKRCRKHVIDTCNYPQCNSACPKVPYKTHNDSSKPGSTGYPVNLSKEELGSVRVPKSKTR